MLNVTVGGQESKCVAAQGRLQGWAATLLLCARGDILFFCHFIGMLSMFRGVVTLRLTPAAKMRWGVRSSIVVPR